MSSVCLLPGTSNQPLENLFDFSVTNLKKKVSILLETNTTEGLIAPAKLKYVLNLFSAKIL